MPPLCAPATAKMHRARSPGPALRTHMPAPLAVTPRYPASLCVHHHPETPLARCAIPAPTRQRLSNIATQGAQPLCEHRTVPPPAPALRPPPARTADPRLRALNRQTQKHVRGGGCVGKRCATAQPARTPPSPAAAASPARPKMCPRKAKGAHNHSGPHRTRRHCVLHPGPGHVARAAADRSRARAPRAVAREYADCGLARGAPQKSAPLRAQRVAPCKPCTPQRPGAQWRRPYAPRCAETQTMQSH